MTFFVPEEAPAQPETASQAEEEVPAEEIPGRYEWITLTPTVPQSVIGCAPATIMPHGGMNISGHTRNKWEKVGDYGFKMDMGAYQYEGAVATAWDAEQNKPTLIITGIRNDGVCFWAKKVGEIPQRFGPGSGAPTV